MTKVIIDSNIIINVWRNELDPLTGLSLKASSSEILYLVFYEKIKGILLSTTAMEVLHSVRLNAMLTKKPVEFSMKSAERDLSRIGLILSIPNSSIMGLAYNMLYSLQTDPFDVIMVAAALVENAGAIISRDKKLKKKAAKHIPVLTPEEFLSKSKNKS